MVFVESGKLDEKISYWTRIAIIRSLQQPFDFILLDEPFSHLDEHNRHLAMALIEAEAKKRNAAIILADLKQIDYFNADSILFL